MKITTTPPEPQVILSLEQRPDGVVLLATLDDDVQAVMVFSAAGKPTADDAMAQRNHRLTAHTLKLRDTFPADVDAHGHIEVRMKA